MRNVRIVTMTADCRKCGIPLESADGSFALSPDEQPAGVPCRCGALNLWPVSVRRAIIRPSPTGWEGRHVYGDGSAGDLRGRRND